VVVAELLCLLIVLYWPVSSPESTTIDFSTGNEPLALIDPPVITHQQSAPSAPPAPQVPVPVPNDEAIEQEVILPQINISNFGDPLATGTGSQDQSGTEEGGVGEGQVVGDPQTPPRVIRIVEPTFENRSPNKADIYVKFLVNKDGTVENATISRILLYDEEGNPTMEVDQITDRVVKATIQAAMDWKFRPAKEDEKPVQAYSTQVFIVDY